MPHYRLLWLEIAERQYLDLPTQLLDSVDPRLAQLVDDPTSDPQATYDAPSDHWSIPIGEQGLLVYAVVTTPPTAIILRWWSREHPVIRQRTTCSWCCWSSPAAYAVSATIA